MTDTVLTCTACGHRTYDVGEPIMKMFHYRVRFLTPAFLGDAEQNGRWRTPPFKALLRQWWRVAYAADHEFNVNVKEMRREEGQLFGHAWLDDDRDENGQKVAARKSLIRIRLSHWNEGSETKASWERQEMQSSDRVIHPEVGRIGPLLYLGYGPLEVEKPQAQGERSSATVLKKNAAIQAGESATLSVAVPEKQEERVQRALWLMDRYGTAGGRSRNGWGSFSMAPLNGTPALVGNVPLRAAREALTLDWPHSVGRDGNGALIWATKPMGDWKQVMRELAIIKIGLRTQFLLSTGNNASHPEARHWLSHPITKHNVADWKQGRLPNSLRFKVRQSRSDPNKLVGVIFHVPCRPPAKFKPDQEAIERTWQAVHALLGELTLPDQSRTYATISNSERKARLKPTLDGIILTRAPE